jgi:talin
LVEDTKTLVAGAASSQEQLASAAQAAVRTITKVIEIYWIVYSPIGVNKQNENILFLLLFS